MIKTIRIMLLPNNKQRTRFIQYADTARFAYNWALEQEINNYKNGEKFLSDSVLRRKFTLLKKTKDYAWLNDINCDVPKQAIKDACKAYDNFFKGKSKYPKFKSKKFSTPSFFQDNCKIKFTDTHVKLMLISGKGKAGSKRNQKFCRVRLAEHGRIPTESVNYYNPRIKYDGLNWWLTVGIECKDSDTFISNNEGIGIDLGIKDLAICSDKNTYPNINKTKTVKNLEKKKCRLQRSISRKYENNKKGESYSKTKNIIKSEKKLLKLNHRLTNIRTNYLHQTTTEIIKREPSFICIEDLNVSGMMKNRNLSKAIQQQKLYEFRKQIEYKAKWNNIHVVIADRFFPSSKLCSCCGNIKKDLKLKDRIYVCECGNVIDRDYQASINLKRYGENTLNIVA